jgi:hypothetical protein
MPVTSVIVITQIDVEPFEGGAREAVLGGEGTSDIRETPLSASSSSRQTHVPAVSNPAASSVPGGWATREPEIEHWSDSPLNQPTLLYRRRFSFGRDIQELFEQPARPGQGFQPLLASGSPGRRWGNLDGNSGVLVYEDLFGTSEGTDVLEFWVYGTGIVQEYVEESDSSFSIKEAGPVTGEVTVSEYPFLLDALPKQYSVKNPITTDIYIRLGNFTSIFDPDSFELYIDDALQTGLVVEEFFSGLGGFDVTWPNSMSFEYDAQVDVHWKFRDTDVPATLFEIKYPFYTVPDSAGPRVTNLVPGDEAVDVPISGSIQFDLEDFEVDVDVSSLLLYVNNIKAVNGVTGTLELTRLLNEKGYTVKYTHFDPWLYGDLIPVVLFVRDTSVNSNETFYSYSFTTIESTPPRLINLRPLACTIVIPVGTHVGLDIVDGGHGLDKSSIVFTVEDIERGGQIALIPIIHRDE